MTRAGSTTASPTASPAPSPAVDDHREQFLRAYLRHRVGERLAGFEQAQSRYTSARRWATALTVLLFTAAAALGAVAVADDGRRALWAFLATVAAALATAVTTYEATFSFRVLSRRSADGVALLHLLQAHGAPEGEDGVNAFRTEVESVLRHSA
jgi:peptidoglycan/LPS O-acetylase OafA/YrhL